MPPRTCATAKWASQELTSLERCSTLVLVEDKEISCSSSLGIACRERKLGVAKRIDLLSPLISEIGLGAESLPGLITGLGELKLGSSAESGWEALSEDGRSRREIEKLAENVEWDKSSVVSTSRRKHKRWLGEVEWGESLRERLLERPRDLDRDRDVSLSLLGLSSRGFSFWPSSLRALR